MKLKKRILLLLLPAVLMALALTGCMKLSTDELYQLPELSEGYISLQDAVNTVTDSGAEFFTPISGSNRQALQMVDINGDGSKEALGFFNMPGESNPLQIHIFEKVAGSYKNVAVISGSAVSIESINYADMNGDRVKEIIVGWQISSGMNLLSVYTVNDFEPVEIIRADYSEYTMCELSGKPDVMVLRMSGTDLSNEAILYSMAEDGEVVSRTAYLSDNIDTLLRIRPSRVRDRWNAVYVEGSMADGSMVTDILVYKSGGLRNVTLEHSGLSESTVRTYSVYCRDINGDGMLDVPQPVLLPAQSDAASYYVINWYTYSSFGNRFLTVSTYHNFFDSWYLRLPEDWRGRITVRREDSISGERRIIFSLLGKSGDLSDITDFLEIYALSGSSREDRAESDGRFVLLREADTVYAAKLLTEPDRFPLELSEELIRSSFAPIYSEWITGEI